MLILNTFQQLQQAIQSFRAAQKSIALVPTMGNLHSGHLQLVKTARKHADVVIVSLFVNPTQFGANEDLDNYPKTHQADIEKLEELNTELLFMPSIKEIYPLGGENTTHVHVPQLTRVLCGASRPGHFDGVTTIVCKLFNMTGADIAIFGEKDFQQLAVIRRMVADLNIPITIIGEAIVRESDGLAMSSRNGYLSTEQRKIAPKLYQVLLDIQQKISQGRKNYTELEKTAKTTLKTAGFKPDYISIVQHDTLLAAQEEDTSLVILAAAYLGKTRLIDNINIQESQILATE